MNKSDMKKILADTRMSVPVEVKKELLVLYTGHIVDDEGHEIQYTEQDVYEQLRKSLRRYEERRSRRQNFFNAPVNRSGWGKYPCPLQI